MPRGGSSLDRLLDDLARWLRSYANARAKREQAQERAIERAVAITQARAAALDGRKRQPIPKSVRMFVWQRDGGKCVQCGATERLEYDHIVALIRGGSNTERNLQLLCERCNRSKGAQI